MLATSRVEMSSASGQEEPLQCGSQERASDRHFDVYFLEAISGVKKSIAVKGLLMCPLYLSLLEEIVSVIIKESPQKESCLVDSSSGSILPHFKTPKDGWDRKFWEYLVGKTIGNIIPEEWILNSLTRVPHYKCAPSSISLLHANICFSAGNLQVLLSSRAWDYCVPTDLSQYWFVPELRI